ncbi:MAG TPA: serine/threonine-protein kinase [Isosphaeraceae bacterium]
MTDDAQHHPPGGDPDRPGSIPPPAPAADPLDQTETIVWTGPPLPPAADEPTTVLSGTAPGEFPEVDDLVESRLGQYRIGAVIGRGSMGRVYRAEHRGLARTCALKVIDPALVSRQPEVLDQFWAEARAVAHLVHPHVVTIHNLGSDRGYHYIEMEHVPGGHTLKEAVQLHGALDAARATALVRQVALGLGAAHRAGLVHRDVKLANVLLTPEGLAKLADFGLVHRLDNPAGAAVAGTPVYMAPELFEGVPAGPRTDLYALGVLFYGLLAGRPPFAAEQIGALIALHREAPVPALPPSVPEEVAAIVARLLAKEPARRPATADELAEDLHAALLQLTDAEGLVRDSLRGLDGQVQGEDGRYRVLLALHGGRRQEVFIEVAAGRIGQQLLTVYSVCGPADPAHFEFALKLNAELSYSGLSVREVAGRPMFVMTRSYPRGHVSPAEIRAVLLEIARRGDWVEEQLTRADVF